MSLNETYKLISSYRYYTLSAIAIKDFSEILVSCNDIWKDVNLSRYFSDSANGIILISLIHLFFLIYKLVLLFYYFIITFLIYNILNYYPISRLKLYKFFNSFITVIRELRLSYI
jgi:hypothetical protein